MSGTKINEAKIGRYVCKLLAYMKEYNQGLYTELLLSGGLAYWVVAMNAIREPADEIILHNIIE